MTTKNDIDLNWDEATPGGLRPEYVLKLVLNRVLYLQEQVPCRENTEVIYHLRQAILWEEIRNNTRKEQGVQGTNAVHN